MIKALPEDLQKGIDLTLADLDWDKLLADADLGQYTGDRLAQVLGIFYHAKELWIKEKERRVAERQ